MACADTPAARARRRTWPLFIGVLMVAYFGTSVALFAPVQNVLPRLVETAAEGRDKTAYLGLVTGVGAVAAMVFNPLAGYFSDRRAAFDNRSLPVMIGMVTGALSLAALGQQRSVAGLVICWALCQAAINTAYSSMAASVIDHVPRSSWGVAWGLVAAAQAFGLIAGFAVVVLAFPGATAGMTAVTCVYVACLGPLAVVLHRLPKQGRGQPAGHESVRAWLTALLAGGSGFGAVWTGKFLVMLANSIALLYLFYYLQDVVRYPRPGTGQLIIVVVVTIATILATVATGRLADHSGGYRRYAIAATVLLAATGFALAVVDSWNLVITCAFALGIGYGAFQSVSQALSMAVLPDPASAARDLGIINVAASIPQVIAPPVAAVVIMAGAGYRGLFVFGGLLALGAAFAFARVPD